MIIQHETTKLEGGGVDNGCHTLTFLKYSVPNRVKVIGRKFKQTMVKGHWQKTGTRCFKDKQVSKAAI